MIRAWPLGFLLAAAIPLHTVAAAGTVRAVGVSASSPPPPGSTEAGLWLVSEEAENLVRRSPRRLLERPLESYLKTVVCRLSPPHCGNIRLYVMRIPYFNASMMPNGTMQIWTGLLLRLNNEAQLATVLGHELAHYTERHALAQFQRVKNTSALFTLFTIGLQGSLAAGGMSGGLAQGMSLGAQIAALGALMAFSREQERAADTLGLSWVAEAGYAPDQAALIWGQLLGEQRAAPDDAEGRNIFTATHPSAEDRLATLASEARALEDRPHEAPEDTRARYLAAVGPFLLDWVHDELALQQPARSAFLFRQLLEAGASPGLLAYALGEVERMNSKETAPVAARDLYLQSVAAPDAPPIAFRALGLWYLRAGEEEAARGPLATYLARSPQAPDAAMIQQYLDAPEIQP